jgi:hypothetical protein
MKLHRNLKVWALACVIAGVGCGDSGDGGDGGDGGGTVDSNAALQGFMQAIALDFAQVLADAAPSSGTFAAKYSARRRSASFWGCCGGIVPNANNYVCPTKGPFDSIRPLPERRVKPCRL